MRRLPLRVAIVQPIPHRRRYERVGKLVRMGRLEPAKEGEIVSRGAAIVAVAVDDVDGAGRIKAQRLPGEAKQKPFDDDGELDLDVTARQTERARERAGERARERALAISHGLYLSRSLARSLSLTLSLSLSDAFSLSHTRSFSLSHTL